jgi:hypothetical protein
MPTYQNLGDVYYFAVYDEINHPLLYTKYNFLFDEYRNYFKLNFNLTKNELFHDFLIKNDTDLEKKFTLKDEFKQFFSPITKDIIDYFYKYSYTKNDNSLINTFSSNEILTSSYIENQFELINYNDDEIVRLQNYTYETNKEYYTKYNFDFDKYSKDFNVWGNKLTIFTDYLIRTMYLNKCILGKLNGFGYPLENFKKYFIQTIDPTSIDLKIYLINYGISSIYKNVTKSLPNIDFIKYGLINEDLKSLNNNVYSLKEHFLTYGQFEKRIIPFIRNDNNSLKDFSKASVIVASKDFIGSGFLYTGGNNQDVVNNLKRIYVITSYDLIRSNSNKNTFKVCLVFNKDDETTYGTNVVLGLQFKIIGYDLWSNICVGLYDPSLEYNIINNKNLDLYILPTINIYTDEILSIGDKVSIIGNVLSNNNSSYLEGAIIDPNFGNNFKATFMLGAPPSILFQIKGSSDLKGCPIFIDKNGTIKCIGMYLSDYGPDKEYSVGINAFTLGVTVNYLIDKWFTYSDLYKNNIFKLNFFIKEGWPKKWLGIKASYFHPVITRGKFKEFANFSYVGGLVIEDFIIGFNYILKEFVYDNIELNKRDVISLKTPLLNTEMYNKFIMNSKVPLIIESIYINDNFFCDYRKYYLGKFGNQSLYDKITYGFAQIFTQFNDSKYINTIKRFYSTIEINYYYFNGLKWIKSNEKINGFNEDSFYETQDLDGNYYYDNVFDFPSILSSYIDNFKLYS